MKPEEIRKLPHPLLDALQLSVHGGMLRDGSDGVTPQEDLESKLTAHSRNMEQRLTAAVMALRELLEQVESLAGYELTKDVESYKAEAIWEYVNEQASETLAAIKVAK